MNLDFAFICDYAEVSGKINALGIGFDTIYSPKVPAKHPLFFLVFHVNEFRGFEKFCEGRLYTEMPSITPRICGICPVSHSVSSAKAAPIVHAPLWVSIPSGP